MRIIIALALACASAWAQGTCGRMVVNPTTGKQDCIGPSGAGTGTVTSVSESCPPWESCSIANATTTPTVTVSGATGPSHYVVGTFGGTTFTTGQLGFADLANQIATGQLPNTTVTAGNYGDATHTVTLAVDATGRLTSVSTNAISGGTGAADSSYLADFTCARTSGTVVTCSWAAHGVNFSSNGYVKNMAGATCTVTLASPAGSQHLMARWDPAAPTTVTVDTSASSFSGVTIAGTCTQGAANVTVDTFPKKTKPLLILTTAGANTWDAFSDCTDGTAASGCINRRATYSVDQTNAGSGLTETLSNGIQTLTLDRTLSPFYYTGTTSPGTVSGSQPGDIYVNTTAGTFYYCVSGSNPCTTWNTAAATSTSPYSGAFTAITSGNWSTLGTGGSRNNVTGPGGNAINVVGSSGTANLYGITNAVSGNFDRYLIFWTLMNVNSFQSIIAGFTDGANWEACGPVTIGNGATIFATQKETSLTNNTGTVANGVGSNLNLNASPFYIHLNRTGTTYKCDVSYDGGISYQNIFTDTTPFATATSIFVGANPRGGSGSAPAFTLISCSTGTGGC